MKMSIRVARIEDLDKLIAFLEKAELDTLGIAEAIDHFLLMEDEEGEISATIGIEVLGGNGLLRSFVVQPGMGERDLFHIFDHILHFARGKQLKEVYLATNKEDLFVFFEILGFATIGRQYLPKEFYQSERLKPILDVDNSIFMKFSL